jgi:predicted acyltransferase
MKNINQRLQSADIYRGFVMFLMLAETLQLSAIAKKLPNDSFWRFLGFHQDHVSWVGCSLHDLIQPSFSFLVGVVLPYSLANKVHENKGFSSNLLQAIKRSLILICLGIFLRSQFDTQTYFTFEDTLSQIGLGYPLLFLLGNKTQKTQLTVLIFILISYWAAFAFYPLPNSAFDYTNAGLLKDWEHNLNGFAAHWNKNTNFAWAFDRWFLNLFPRKNEFLFNSGGYSTLSFVPTLATMILGLLAGNILKFNKNANIKLKRFLILGFAGLLIGYSLDFTGICPNVKRIWTPTWVIFSGGWCFLLLAFFYWIIDLKQKGNWFYFLHIIGINSIAAYIVADALGGYISNSLKIHLGQNYANIFGETYHSLFHGGLMIIIYWLILRWMYLKKIFIKI